MTTQSSPDIMQMLRTDMRYTSQRQKMLAENVANVDTPGFKAEDLKKPDFNAMVSQSSSAGHLAMAETSPHHLPGVLGKGSSFAAAEIKGGETTPSGNNVDLPTQMASINETVTQHELATSLFKKFTSLYHIALGKN